MQQLIKWLPSELTPLLRKHYSQICVFVYKPAITLHYVYIIVCYKQSIMKEYQFKSQKGKMWVVICRQKQ